MKLKMSLGLGLGLAGFLFASPSQAVNILGASAGAAYYPSELSAFRRNAYNHIEIDNLVTWAPGRYWTVDAPVSSTGSKTFSVAGYSVTNVINSNATTCAAIATNVSGGIATWTLHQVLQNVTSFGSMTTLGTFTVNADQAVQYECLIATATDVNGFRGFVTSVKGF